MRDKIISTAYHDGARLTVVGTEAVKDALPGEVCVHVQVVGAVASGFHDGDAERCRNLDGLKVGIGHLDRPVIDAADGVVFLCLEQQDVSNAHVGNGIEDGVWRVVGPVWTELRNDPALGSRHDADATELVVDHEHLAQDRGAVPKPGVAVPGNQSNANSRL